MKKKIHKYNYILYDKQWRAESEDDGVVDVDEKSIRKKV